MRVRARLILFGAALPSLALVLAVGVAGVVFRGSLLGALDRALLAQAAVESVSLFDGPTGAPHVHLGKSPLAENVRSFVPMAGLYDGTGKLVSHFPENGWIPDRPAADAGAEGPRLSTQRSSDGRWVRSLVVAVRAPWGEPYVLTLQSSLVEIDATMRLYWQATLGLVAVAAALLFFSQWVQAGRMSRRIADMTAQLPELRGGALAWRLPPDPTGDEIADLRVALAEAMERLRAARDAQERLIANAAHELRTPLGLMRTEMDLALRKERSVEELREALSEARGEVTRLSNLAARLLDLAALGKVTWEAKAGDLSAVVREAAEACEGEAEARGVRMAVSLPEEAPAAFEAQTTRQAIDNLLSNAMAHAPRGTTISVGIEAMGEVWRISVEDEGEGVRAEEAEHIFEPFFRGAKAKQGQGAGLGLSIVREIARRHGGKVYLAPKEGRGARFVLEISRQG
ncbi:sensor histidine kinase [Polyangium jinanense]|uniref:histidine kinase n=1 Tax=Polyangium jinanense TaxID=2829994 RepID=A0A9X4AXV5_9BACT|nr:HAMP domain-containing sensor histidine kinase [Polyangium jinanense]MDC3957183.1 HAMP domain-containing histidine kinase [Polyangium jinanense]MDC3986660.1 HAMP domain-containing histidine kinase [Polyangium jinanense]